MMAGVDEVRTHLEWSNPPPPATQTAHEAQGDGRFAAATAGRGDNEGADLLVGIAVKQLDDWLPSAK